MKTNIKVIATSLSLATSVGAVAGIGGLSVQSHLGQPFSGSIVVSGDEARALIASGAVNVSGGGIRGSMVKQGEDRVLVRLRSSSPVREPVITFTVTAGRQTREYTAFLDPVRYTPKEIPVRQNHDVDDDEHEVRQGKGKKRTPQHDFIERKKTNAAERRPASSISAQADSEEMTVLKKTSKVAVSPRRHRAHVGESVASIAERYRPRNMSQQTAMRALMLANPSAFKHGTTIRRNVTLYIPTESQWHAYAQRAQKQVMKERVKQMRKTAAVAPHQPETLTTSGTDNVAVTPPPVMPVEKAKSVEKAKPAPVQQTKPASVEQPRATPASKPSETKIDAASQSVEAAKTSEVQSKAVEPVNQDVQVASQAAEKSSSQPVQPMQPENASKVNAASQASEVMLVPVPPVVGASAASAASVVVEPAPQPTPPVASPPPVVEEAVEEEETDYLPFVAVGLGSAVVLSGLGYILARRRKNTTDSSSDEDEWDTEETTQKNPDEDEWGGDINFGGAATHSTATVSSSTAHNHFDDEFSLDNISPTSTVNSNHKDEFDLGNFEPDNSVFDTFNDNQATQNQRQNDDWAWVEGETSSQSVKSHDDFVVAEEDEWSMDKLDSISQSNKNVEQTFSLDDFVVDDIQPTSTTTTAAVSTQNQQDDVMDSFDLSDFDEVKQPERSTASPTVQADDNVFDLDNFDVPVSTSTSTIQAANTVSDEESTFGLDAFDDFVVSEPVVEKAAVVDVAADLPAFDDEFVLPDTETTNKVVQPVADENLAFGLDAFDDFVVSEPVVEKAEVVDVAADLPVLDEGEFALPNAETTSAIQPTVNEDLAFGLDAFDDFIVPESEPEKATVVDAVTDLAAFDDGEFAVPTTPTVGVQAAVDEDLAFGLDAFEDFTPAEPVAESKPDIQAASDVDLAFGLDAFEDFTPVEPVVESKPDIQAASDVDLAFGLDAFEDFTPAEPVVESKPDIQAASDVDLAFGLDAFDDFTPAEQPVVESKPDIQAASDVDLAFGLDAFEDFTPVEPVVESKPDIQAASDADLAFGLDAFDELIPTEKTDVSSSIDTAQINDVVLDDFNVAATEMGAVTIPEIDESPISFDVPAVEEEPISLDVPIINASLDDLLIDVEVEMPQVSSSVGMLDLATGPLNAVGSSTLDAVNLDSLEVMDDLQDWDTNNNGQVGFVSGAVSDMTEPLEAKFELAKMYLEIDDAVAARETLRELIAESSGNIQEQAKQLLADLGN